MIGYPAVPDNPVQIENVVAQVLVIFHLDRIGVADFYIM
jgi:hypothetical protein